MNYATVAKPAEICSLRTTRITFTSPSELSERRNSSPICIM